MSCALGRQTSFSIKNKEMSFFSLPWKTARRAVQRADFNVRGETSSASTTYTGVVMRRFCELPRMSRDVKSSILGAAAAESLRMKRAQRDIDEKGRLFSFTGVKPLNLWQTILDHHAVTQIVDFTPGSAGLAVAAAGVAECDGIAANDARKDWLDSIADRRIMYKVGHDKDYAAQFERRQ